MNSSSLRAPTASPLKLTRFAPGSVRELTTIVWPLVLSFLSMALMNLFNRYFLSHYSTEALEAAVSAMNLAILFQIPCMRITTIAQIFVARFAGSQESEKIGSVIWQMIWLSLISLFLTLPLGLGIGTLFFKGTVVETIGLPYFKCLMLGNFLFPLGGALAAFFSGLGRTKIITMSLAIAHIFQICLDWLLIFGIPGIFAPQGAFGAAISTIAAQSLYCLILFSLFLQHRSSCRTDFWRLKFSLLKEMICLGAPRAFAKLVIVAAWAGVNAILTHKAGDYLLAFSIGTSIYAVFSCLNEGLGQGIITAVSYYIGGKQFKALPQIARSSLVILGGILFILSFFLLFFPQFPIHFFSAGNLTQEQISFLIASCHGLWFFFFCDGLSWIGFGFINALKEMKFYLIYTLCTVFFFNYLPLHLAFQHGDWSVEMLWWIMSLPCLASAVAYYFRIKERIGHSSILQSPEELQNETTL